MYIKHEIPWMYSDKYILENFEGKAEKYQRTRLGVSARDKQNTPVYVVFLYFFFNRMINNVATFPKTPAMQRVVAVMYMAPYRRDSSKFSPGSTVGVCSERF
jgi:hypothetical protein